MLFRKSEQLPAFNCFPDDNRTVLPAEPLVEAAVVENRAVCSSGGSETAERNASANQAAVSHWEPPRKPDSTQQIVEKML